MPTLSPSASHMKTESTAGSVHAEDNDIVLFLELEADAGPATMVAIQPSARCINCRPPDGRS